MIRVGNFRRGELVNTSRPKLLIVDDKSRYVEFAHALLREYDYAVRCELSGPCFTCECKKGCTLTHAHDWAETVQALAKHRDVDVVLLDVVFDLPKERLLLTGDGDLARSRRVQGIEILKRLRSDFSDLPVVLMTSEEELRLEEAASALLADEYVTLAGTDAFDARAVAMLIERILSRRARSGGPSDYLFGKSSKTASVMQDAVSFARTSLPMMILGETGVGKSALVEKVIHPASLRKGPLITVDFAAIPETLAAAELFGTVTGAFSGAKDRIGCIEQAAHGTLFLDEIGNLKEEVQRMLLVTLQTGRFSRLGESQSRQSDIKLVVASNQDLGIAVKEGRFRADLYTRLNPAARLTVPSLRDRKEDIWPLMQLFVEQVFREPSNLELLKDYMKLSNLKGTPCAELVTDSPTDAAKGVRFVLSKRNVEILSGHPFYGNVRELQMMIGNLVLFALLDALRAVKEGRGGLMSFAIPVSSKLVRRLLDVYRVTEEGTLPDSKREFSIVVEPASNLREVARSMEKEVMTRLYEKTVGDFEKMAERLLVGDPGANARRVLLRFNQLGLKVRNLQKRICVVDTET
jgi:DNA-binding NtrC family response regulator